MIRKVNILICLGFLLSIPTIQAQDFMKEYSEKACDCLSENEFINEDSETQMSIVADCFETAATQLSGDNLMTFISMSQSENGQEDLGIMLIQGLAKYCSDYAPKLIELFAILGSKDSEEEPRPSIDAEASIQKVELFLEKGRFQEALALLNDLISAYPSKGQYWVVRGKTNIQLDRYYPAIGDFYAALQLTDEYNGICYKGLGYAQIGLGDYKTAIGNLRTAQSYLPDDTEIFNELGTGYYNLQEYDSAIYFFRKNVEVEPQDYLAAYNLMYSLGEYGERDQAMDVIEEAMHRFDNKAQGYLLRAEFYFELQEYADARADYEKAIEKGLEDPTEAIRSIGTSNYYLEDYSEAYKYFDMLIEEYGMNNASTLSDRGLTLLELEKYRSALKDFDKAIRMEPENITLYDNRGKVYLAMESWRKAERDFDRSLAVYPSDVEVLYLRGQARLGSGNLAGACADFHSATEVYNFPEAEEALAEHCSGSEE